MAIARQGGGVRFRQMQIARPSRAAHSLIYNQNAPSNPANRRNHHTPTPAPPRRRSVGSFDSQGVHPSTSSSKGSYADPAISNAIKASNDAVNGGRVLQSSGGGEGGPAAVAAPAAADQGGMLGVGR
jgi:hypothetical protein